MKRFNKKHAKEHVQKIAHVQEKLYLCNRNKGVKVTTSKNGATANQQKAMKEIRNIGRTKMWYVVDYDGWGKLYKNKPQRKNGIWLSSTKSEAEPTHERLLLPADAKKMGRTNEDEPTQVEMIYEVTIQINE